MDLDLHIRRNPAAVALAVQQPELAAGFARMFEDFLTPDLATVGEVGTAADQRADAAVLARVTPAQWKALGGKFAGDAIFERCVAEAKAGKVPQLTAGERHTVENTWKPAVLAVVGGLTGAVGVIAAVFTAAAIILAAIGLGLLAGIAGLLAALFTGIAVLGGTLLTFLWLFLPDRVPADPTLYGGDGGDPFMDRIPLEAAKIHRVEVKAKAGDVIRAVRVTWRTVHGALITGAWSSEGSWDGVIHPVTFADDEYLVALRGRQDGYVRQLELVTNKKSYGPYGKPAGEDFEAKAEIGAIMGLRGRAKGWLDAIGVLSGMQRVYHGGFGGVPFCDPVADVQRISRVDLRWSASGIEALRLNWVLEDGSTRVGPWYGGTGGHEARIDIADGQRITAVAGFADTRIRQLVFTVGGREVPVGVTIGQPFRFEVPHGDTLLGFFGRAHGAVDGIGPLVARGERVYWCQNRYGARRGEWKPTHPITWTRDDRVFVGVEREVELFGEWKAPGVFEALHEDEGGRNPEWSGTLRFLPWSEDDYFWPPPGNHGACVIGALGYQRSILDLRGELAPER